MPMIRRESGLQTCLIEPQLTVPQSSDAAAGKKYRENLDIEPPSSCGKSEFRAGDIGDRVGLTALVELR